MATVNVVNWENKKVGQVDLPSEVFEAPVRRDVLHTVVRWQQAGKRQGTHMTKTKGLVSGGGKKPFKQKGTGNARQGSSRSPLMPGGGVTFGPQPRDYSYNLPKSVRRLGMRSALSMLLKEGRLFILDEMSASGKTKEVFDNLKSFGVTKAVLSDSGNNQKLARAAKNLAKYKFLPTDGLNVYDLLKYDALLISKETLGQLAQRCARG